MRLFLTIALMAVAGCQSVPPETTNVTMRQTVATPVVAVNSADFGAHLNAARVAQGRRALTEDARLTRAATAFAQDMQANDYFSHTGRDGSNFSRRARAAGYSCANAENLAFGQPTPADVMEAWMTSSGHRRNVLASNSTEFGIGRAGEYWVLMMGRGGC